MQLLILIAAMSSEIDKHLQHVVHKMNWKPME